MKSIGTSASGTLATRLPESEKNAVLDALHDMLQSPPFRTSRQCQDLLRYVVLHSLEGEDELLRERIIGVEVFGRRPDYDQASDPVVRIRAADVRKRLALYYDQHDLAPSPVRISIPSGCYVASFERVDATPVPVHSFVVNSRVEPVGVPSGVPLPDAVEARLHASPAADIPPAPRPALRLNRMLGWVFTLAAVVLLGMGGTYAWMVQHNPLHRFWAPVLRDSHRALIYAGGNTMYGFAPAFVENYTRTHPLENEKALNRSLIVHLDPDQVVKGSDIVQLANTFVSVGDTATAARIAAYFAVESKANEMRFDQDISVGDLRQQPTVLIGAYNNDWTMQLTDNMRFGFVPGLRIQDRTNPARSWQPRQDLSDDYALVSRVLNSKTDQVVITLAGLGQAGTSAAGAFVTDPKAMQAFIDSAPPGWEKKNFQIVLHTTVMNGSPSTPQIVATAYW